MKCYLISTTEVFSARTTQVDLCYSFCVFMYSEFLCYNPSAYVNILIIKDVFQVTIVSNNWFGKIIKLSLNKRNKSSFAKEMH